MGIIEEALNKARDTKALIIGKGSIERTGEMFRTLFPDKKAFIVADMNTWRVAGKAAEESLKAAGVITEEAFIFTDPDLHAEWSYVKELQNHMKATEAIAVAVGSGVINDLTKYVSHTCGRRYICVGTAASMDGFTAYGASITIDGNKQTLDCPAPLGFVMDPIIAADAPSELAASGYADLIAKIPAGADWIIAEAAGCEQVDPFAWSLVQECLRDALSDPASIHAGDVENTEKLANGLLMSGFAMQAINSSRPASGTEHQFSHCWDMENLCHDGKHVSHGFKVGIGTLISTACIEFLLEQDIQAVDSAACAEKWPAWEDMEKQIRLLFKDKPGHLARALKESKDKYADKEEISRQIEAIKEAWPSLKPRMEKQIMPFGLVHENLRLVGAPYEPEMISVSRDRFRQTLKYIPYMRSRFTCIDVLHRMGLLSEFEQKLFSKGGIWEID